MEAIIFVGLQGSGKSTFYKERFASTHVRINLDTLQKRSKEKALMAECIQQRKPFVVDNTNPLLSERAVYLTAAKAAGYKTIAYYFDMPFEDCKARNEQRTGKAKIHIIGLYSVRKKMVLPTIAEGFDEIRTVKLVDGKFIEI